MWRSLTRRYLAIEAAGLKQRSEQVAAASRTRRGGASTVTERRDDLLRRVVKAAADGRARATVAARPRGAGRHQSPDVDSPFRVARGAADRGRRGGRTRSERAARRIAGRRGRSDSRELAAYSVPSLWPIERLFFECYARGAQGEPPFDRLVPALVEQTLAAVSTRADVGADEEGRAGARLGLAVIRGLLLDLVATGDRKATDRALELYASMVADRSAARQCIGVATSDIVATHPCETLTCCPCGTIQRPHRLILRRRCSPVFGKKLFTDCSLSPGVNKLVAGLDSGFGLEFLRSTGEPKGPVLLHR